MVLGLCALRNDRLTTPLQRQRHVGLVPERGDGHIRPRPTHLLSEPKADDRQPALKDPSKAPHNLLHLVEHLANPPTLIPLQPYPKIPHKVAHKEEPPL